jgi:hypothetical protein
MIYSRLQPSLYDVNFAVEEDGLHPLVCAYCGEQSAIGEIHIDHVEDCPAQCG